MQEFAHIHFMSMLMSALALTFPKSQNTFQHLLTGNFHTNALFLFFIFNYGNSYIIMNLWRQKQKKKNPLSWGEKVICSKYNITEEHKKFNLILLLHMEFHFTMDCVNNLYKIMNLKCVHQNIQAQTVSALFLQVQQVCFFSTKNNARVK